MSNPWPLVGHERLFYGDPAKVEAKLVLVVPPFRIYYEGIQTKGIRIHPKLVDSLKAVLHEVMDHYQTQQAIDANHVSNYSGSYAARPIRGSTKTSMHAYGAAIDFDAEHNQMTQSKTAGFFKAEHPLVKAFKAQGWFWGGDYKNRRDPMHFEALRYK